MQTNILFQRNSGIIKQNETHVYIVEVQIRAVNQGVAFASFCAHCKAREPTWGHSSRQYFFSLFSPCGRHFQAGLQVA